jgi:hypothetical protein
VHGGYKLLVTLDVEKRNIEFGAPKIQAIGCVTQKYSTVAAHPGVECINPHPLRGESECFLVFPHEHRPGFQDRN